MKLAVRILLALAAVLVVGAAALVFRLERSVPPLEGTETLPGLTAPVEVAFDSLGIPHLSAQSDADLFAALGYLHARDRLWQMETLRRAAEGRLSEILGPSTVAADRYFRSLDLARTADRVYDLLPPESRAILGAYVAGVNRWIAHPTRPLPPEFLALRLRPEPWTARNSFEVSRIMAWDLASATTELSMARAAAEVGPEKVRDLFPWTPDSGATIIQRGEGTWTGKQRSRPAAAARGAVPSVLLAANEIPVIPPLALAILDAVSMRRASNSWVIGGRRTASGKPILANDPHLYLRAPSIWYLATLESPGFTVSGATIAGLPPIVIGHNRRIAWGLTNMEADDADYVIERLSADSSRVLTPHGWVLVDVEHDTIRVKGGRGVPFTLRRTPEGPLAGTAPPGRTADSGGTVRALALEWNALTPSDELTALLGVDRAGTWDQFLAAVRGFKTPEQNWIYADVDGTIGYTASGNIPVRHAGEGLLPAPGWTGEGRWERYLDFDELPRVVNPAEGFIVTANNRIVGPEYPRLLSNNPALPWRAARIRELITTARPGGITAADVQRMQLDTVDVFARLMKGVAADAAEAAGRSDVARALRAWDGTQGADRTEPTVFWLWYRDLQRLAYEGVSTAYLPSGPYQHWLFAGRTAAGRDMAPLAKDAMVRALGQAGDMTWGRLHQTVSSHALGSVAALNRALKLDIGPRPRAGSLFTVNVADFGLDPPFTNTHGPSFRQVVDLGDVEGAGMILTTGESGNPASPHYRDQAALWWNGRLETVPLARAGLQPASVLRLVP